MIEQELYEMELHDWKKDSASQIQRVVGGWIYHYDSSAFGTQTSVFVPESEQVTDDCNHSMYQVGVHDNGRSKFFVNKCSKCGFIDEVQFDYFV